MDKLIKALDQLQSLKDANALFIYIMGAEAEVKARANTLRNRVIMYATHGDTWNGQNPKAVAK
jgi:hypothetical protein